MLITEKMKSDMMDVRDEEMLCCDKCGSTNIIEKCWIFVNDVVVINGDCYQKTEEPDDGLIWCKSCGDACRVTDLKTWKKDNTKN